MMLQNMNRRGVGGKLKCPNPLWCWALERYLEQLNVFYRRVTLGGERWLWQFSALKEDLYLFFNFQYLSWQWLIWLTLFRSTMRWPKGACCLWGKFKIGNYRMHWSFSRSCMAKFESWRGQMKWTGFSNKRLSAMYFYQLLIKSVSLDFL